MNLQKFNNDIVFYKPLNEELLKQCNRVVCVLKYNNSWVFCKHKLRQTWEIPGGHIEKNEDWLSACKREMFEETGAVKLSVKPVCIYHISNYGVLCFAEVEQFDSLPDYEIKQIKFFKTTPKKLTYPWHKDFLNIAKNYAKLSFN